MPPKRTKRALEDAGNGGTNASTSKKSSKTTRNSNPGGKENTESSTSSKEEGKGKDKVCDFLSRSIAHEFLRLLENRICTQCHCTLTLTDHCVRFPHKKKRKILMNT